MSKKIIIIIAVLALVALNLALFSGAFTQKKACFRDFCLYGKTDPVNEFKTLVDSADSFILYAEGDEEQTQTTREITLASMQMFSDLLKTQKPVKLVLVSMQDGAAVSCNCDDYTGFDSAECISTDVSHCRLIQPEGNQVMFKFNYPSSSKNEAVIKGRVVDVKSNSGSSMAGIVYVLRGLI